MEKAKINILGWKIAMREKTHDRLRDIRQICQLRQFSFDKK